MIPRGVFRSVGELEFPARGGGDLPDGSEYRNVMIQLMTLRWGKVAEVETLEDLQALEAALRVCAEAGVCGGAGAAHQ